MHKHTHCYFNFGTTGLTLDFVHLLSWSVFHSIPRKNGWHIRPSWPSRDLLSLNRPLIRFLALLLMGTSSGNSKEFWGKKIEGNTHGELLKGVSEDVKQLLEPEDCCHVWLSVTALQWTMPSDMKCVNALKLSGSDKCSKSWRTASRPTQTQTQNN